MLSELGLLNHVKINTKYYFFFKAVELLQLLSVWISDISCAA